MKDADNPWAEIAIEQNRRWLRAYILASTGDHSACDDLVQDVFAIAYEKRDTYTTGTNFGGWLRVIARNVILRYFKQRARMPLFDHNEAIALLDQAAAESEDSSNDLFFQEQRKQNLKVCFQTLTRRVQQLLQLRYTEQKPVQAISKLLAMSVSAVNVAAFRARMALADCMDAREKVERV